MARKKTLRPVLRIEPFDASVPIAEWPLPFDLSKHLDAWLAVKHLDLQEMYKVRREMPKARALSEDIARLESTLDPNATKAMRLIVAHVANAVNAGEQWADDVTWLAAHLEKRVRLRWVLEVRHGIEIRTASWVRGLSQVAETVQSALVLIDDHAKTLTVEQIERRLGAFGQKKTKRAPIDTVAGLAARLAVDCGAFGYEGPRAYAKAKTAFAKAMREKNRMYN